MDDFIKVYEEEGLGRIWLEDVLDDNGIPYKAEPDYYWTGVKTASYHDKMCIYVTQEHRDAVLGFIDEYNNAVNIAWDDTGDSGGDMPQIKCTDCGKAFDFDYPKCPFCNHPV